MIARMGAAPHLMFEDFAEKSKNCLRARPQSSRSGCSVGFFNILLIHNNIPDTYNDQVGIQELKA